MRSAPPIDSMNWKIDSPIHCVHVSSPSLSDQCALSHHLVHSVPRKDPWIPISTRLPIRLPLAPNRNNRGCNETIRIDWTPIMRQFHFTNWQSASKFKIIRGASTTPQGRTVIGLHDVTGAAQTLGLPQLFLSLFSRFSRVSPHSVLLVSSQPCTSSRTRSSTKSIISRTHSEVRPPPRLDAPRRH